MKADARVVAVRIGELSREPPTTQARREVMEALVSEADRVRLEAARTLSVWGDGESVAALRGFLLHGLGPQDFAWVDRATAVRALRRHVTDADAGWLLDLYFAATSVSVVDDLASLVVRLSNAALRDRIVAESRSESPERRIAAARLCAAVHLDEEREILERLSNDPDFHVAGPAREFLAGWWERGRRRIDDPLLLAIATRFAPPPSSEPNELGVPPDETCLLERKGERGPLLQCWWLTPSGAVSIPPGEWRTIASGSKRGAYFETCRITFWLSESGNELHVDWVAGPLFGRGWTFELVHSGRKIRLERPKQRWVS